MCFTSMFLNSLLKEVANKLSDVIDILSKHEKTTIRDDVMKLMKERVKTRFAEWADTVSFKRIPSKFCYGQFATKVD